MKKYKPDYDLLQTFNDIEMGLYVEQCFKEYKYFKNKSSLRKKDE
jgi:hypothetical protein